MFLIKNNIIFYAFFLFTLAYSQSELDNLIKEVYSGKTENAINAMPRLKKEFSELPSLIFLDALIDEDIERSIEKYKIFFKYYESSEYADDAIMKISEYYYTKGLYVESSRWLKKINLYYPNSEHIDRSLNLYLRTLALSGKQDTAKQYLQTFKKKYPEVSFDKYLEDNFEKETANIEETVNNKDNNVFMQAVEDLKKSLTPKQKNKKKYHFSIQVGAYSDMRNAVDMRDELLSLNFNTRIDIIYLSTKNKNLYAVREGYFKSKEYAKGTQKKIRSRTGYNSIVVDINEY